MTGCSVPEDLWQFAKDLKPEGSELRSPVVDRRLVDRA